jgi:hypothetical protein
MFETNPQPFNRSKNLGCCAGFIGLGLAFLSLLLGMCGASSGEYHQDDFFFYVIVAVLGALGINLLIFFYRSWRRP